ncbi:MAG: DUF5680 domain-containing protein [Oscillospiraceae bacterium]|jgi:hypothetical protein|nr:DUF5680 domain-containing protein [Oscillospiraceae bacterium]
MNEKVIQFLIRAKRATYAGKGAEDSPSRPSSHDLHYAEGDLLYIDSFLGGTKFGGEEALWENNIPFWTMNYYGIVTDKEHFSGDFLKESLLRVPENMPFRGPNKYSDGDYKYVCGVSGDFNYFNGKEEIFYCREKIYECLFHGGEVE